MSIKFQNLRTKLGLDDVLTFGVHKGFSVLEVLKYWPAYIAWLVSQGTAVYPSVHDELLRCQAPVLRDKHRRRSNYMMPDYDHDTLGDWFDDVPF